MVIELGISATILAGVCLLPPLWRRSRRRWLRWARSEPSVDPFAAGIGEEARSTLAIVLQGAGGGAPAGGLDEGWNLLHQGKVRAATEIFAGVIQREPDHPGALAGLAAAALQVCAVSPAGWHWRAGLRRALPLAVAAAQGAPADPEICAVEAEIRAALGELEVARSLVSRLPPDHWRACLVRAVLYEASGDPLRGESALNAAIELGPPPVRPRLRERRAALAALWR